MSPEVSKAIITLNQIQSMMNVLERELRSLAKEEQAKENAPNFKFVGEDEFRNAGRNGNYE